MTSKIKALSIATVKNLVPEVLKSIPVCGPALSRVFELGTVYKEEMNAQNLKLFIEQLNSRVLDLEKKLESLEDGKIAEQIQRVIKTALDERNEEKIAFYAAVVAGLIDNFESNRITELHDEFIQAIANLSGTELIILKALYERKPGEAVPLSKKGSNWLNQNIIMDDNTLAWVDVLIKNGLVEDASFETTKGSKTLSNTSHVKSRTSVKLSTFARSMITYLHSVQQYEDEKEL